MQIVLKLKKNVNQNAADYFEKAKKAKKKWRGAEKALANSLKKLEELKEKLAEEIEKEELKKQELANKVVRKKEWYEKYRWFTSSEGFLIIGGRDATTNDIIVKKHVDPGDIIFHTEMSGSPFVIIKAEGKKIGADTMQEAADFTATYSKAWKMGLGTTEVFWVNPDQVSKTALAGEYLAKGAFMIYGKKNFVQGKMNMAIAIIGGGVRAGPLTAIDKQTKTFFIIDQGRDKKSDIAKKIKQDHKEAELDEIMHYLPTGGLKIRKT